MSHNDSGEQDYIALKSLKKCACGHERRIHRAIRNEQKEVIKHGKCLGGSPSAPMSCDCPGFDQ